MALAALLVAILTAVASGVYFVVQYRQSAELAQDQVRLAEEQNELGRCQAEIQRRMAAVEADREHRAQQPRLTVQFQTRVGDERKPGLLVSNHGPQDYEHLVVELVDTPGRVSGLVERNIKGSQVLRNEIDLGPLRMAETKPLYLALVNGSGGSLGLVARCSNGSGEWSVPIRVADIPSAPAVVAHTAAETDATGGFGRDRRFLP